MSKQKKSKRSVGGTNEWSVNVLKAEDGEENRAGDGTVSSATAEPRAHCGSGQENHIETATSLDTDVEELAIQAECAHTRLEIFPLDHQRRAARDEWPEHDGVDHDRRGLMTELLWAGASFSEAPTYCFIASEAGENLQSPVSISQIAGQLGPGMPQFYRAVKALVAAGVLVRNYTNRRSVFGFYPFAETTRRLQAMAGRRGAPACVQAVTSESIGDDAANAPGGIGLRPGESAHGQP